jgi:hypothetical protein
MCVCRVINIERAKSAVKTTIRFEDSWRIGDQISKGAKLRLSLSAPSFHFRLESDERLRFVRRNRNSLQKDDLSLL